MGASIPPDDPLAGYTPDWRQRVPAAAKPPAPATSGGRRLLNLTAGVLNAPVQGLTAGLSDKASAYGVTAFRKLFGDARPMGQIAAAELQATRRASQELDSTAPGLGAGLQIAGALAPAALTGGLTAPASAASISARAAPTAGQRLLGTLTGAHVGDVGRAATGVRGLLGAGARGAVEANVAAAGSADGSLANRLRTGLQAAPAGFAAALGGQTLIPRLVNGMGRVDQAITGTNAAPTVDRATRRAFRFLTEDLADGGKPAGALLADYQQGRVPADAPLVETGGKRLAADARNIRVLGGPGATRVETEMKAMKDGQHAGVRQDFERAFGGPAVDHEQHTQFLRNERERLTAPLYDHAYARAAERWPRGIGIDPAAVQQGERLTRGAADPVVGLAQRTAGETIPAGAALPRDIASLLELPYAAEAWKWATTNAAARRRPLPQAFKVVRTADPINEGLMSETLVPAGAAPDLRALHEFKRGLRTIYEQKAEKGLIAADVAGAVAQQLDEVQDIIARYVPEYGEANRAYRAQSMNLDAFDQGRGALTRDPSTLRTEVDAARRVAPDLTEQGAAPLREYRRGQHQQAAKIIGDVSDNRDALVKVWENDNVRERLRETLSPEEYAQLEQAMTRRGDQRDLVRFVTGGPDTADKLAGMGRLTGDVPEGALAFGASLATQNPAPAVGWGARAALKARGMRIGKETGRVLADQMFSPQPVSILRQALGLEGPLAEQTLLQQARTPGLNAVARALGRASGVGGDR